MRTQGMGPDTHRFHSGLGWLLLAVAAAVMGCGTNRPNMNSNTTSEVQFVPVPRHDVRSLDGDASVADTTDSDDSPDLDDSSNSGPSDPSGGAVISAADGGEISVGRHTVTFAPGALARDTEITVVDVTNSSGRVEVQLYPEGLVFLAPVTLECDFSDLAPPQGFDIFWLMESPAGNEVWLNMGGEVTPDGRGVIVTLEHFSTYAPGKAGW